jgi:FkbM family methyltransferase
MDDFDGDLVLHLRLDEHMESRIFWHGSYSRDVLCALDRLLRPGDCFLDVGANVGEIPVCAAKRVGTAGRVVALEPHGATRERLERHVRENGFAHVSIVAAAAGRTEGTVRLYGPAARWRDGSFHSGLFTAYPTGERDAHVGETRVVTIDGIVDAERLPRVDGVKIDVEGGELDVLLGAERTIARFRPWIVLEVNRATSMAAGYAERELLDRLARLDYAFELIGRLGALRAIDADSLGEFQNVLCTPRRHGA